jgi:preprotein translocase subunit SecA
MAGRGTDIKLEAGVEDLGGLFVLGTERHESRRIDRQLRGRCARQGDPGASQFFISFEDDLMRNFGAAERMTKMMERFGVQDGEALEHGWLNKTVENAQKRVEQRNYIWRKHVLDYDDVMNRQREVVYGLRNEVLVAEDPRAMIYDFLEEAVSDRADQYLKVSSDSQADGAGLLSWVTQTFPLALSADDVEFSTMTPEEATQFIVGKVKEVYEQKVANERAQYLDSMERQTVLSAIDKLWQEHLYNMDALREGVRLRAQGQKDPLIEYKKEAYDLFVTLMDNINLAVLKNMFSSTTNLDAFEEFLASLSPDAMGDSDDEDGESPQDFLSALREQVAATKSMMHDAANKAQQPEPAPLPEPQPEQQGSSAADMIDTSISMSSDDLPPAFFVNDQKIELTPRVRTFVDISTPAGAKEEASDEGESEQPKEVSVTVGSMDSGSVLGTFETSGETLTR